MCELCDGKTFEQLFLKIHQPIASGRWAIQGVEAGPRDGGWIYTVGLTHNFGHPELVIVDADERDAARLNAIGERISYGLRVDASSTVDLDGYVVGFGTVHESYLARGLCASWSNYNAWIGARPEPLEVLQVVLPRAYCEHHDGRQRCLATPGSPGFGDVPNRAGRRAKPPRRRR